jgi:hypothetical protein
MGKMLFWTLPIITTCNCTFIEKRKYVEVLAVVDATRPGDFGGMGFLQGHKKGEYTKVRHRP